MRGSTVIANVGTFVQAQDAAVVPVVHAIAGGQPVAPGIAFVGRQLETETLLAALAQGNGKGSSLVGDKRSVVDTGPGAGSAGDAEPVRGPGSVVVSAVAGMGGVGKTALARFCAAEAVARGWFPGGAYVVDLQGYSPGGTVARDTLFAPLLHQFGVPAENIPAEPAAQAAVYDQALRLLAEQGRRVLLVLDNASTTAQVDGLLPTSGDHRVVVTTRDTLMIPGARRLDLDVLPEADAITLLGQALREHGVAVTEGAAELVRVCGWLPLAIRIAAGLLADEPDMSCAELAAELASATADGFAHGETRVAPVLAASIDRLAARDPQAEQLLRLLPINPGPDLSTEAAAALGGLSVAAARTSLRTLRQAHLITHSERRWRLHDLVRRYLLDRLVVRDAATIRLLDYYRVVSRAADDHLRALPDSPVPDLFAGRKHALEWFDAEHANLVAAVQLAAASEQFSYIIYLTGRLAEYQNWRRLFNDKLTVSKIALDVCQENGDRRNEGAAWGRLGIALRELRRFKEAIVAHEHARDIAQEVKDRLDEMAAWNNLGLDLQALERFDEAITAHEHDLTICQEVGERRSEGMAWGNLGIVLHVLGRLDEALAARKHARDIFQEIGDRYNEGKSWVDLGITLRELGRLDEAVAAHEHACDVLQETGDRYIEGVAWYNLGLTLLMQQRFAEARRCTREAIAAYTESEDAKELSRAQRLLELIDTQEKSTGS